MEPPERTDLRTRPRPPYRETGARGFAGVRTRRARRFRRRPDQDRNESCLGLPKAPNPQQDLEIRHLKTPILLSNSIHDPATGYNWATDVARQLGRNGVLLTYQGWGHGSYNKSPCVQSAIDDYLVSLKVPARGSSCPAVAPTG
ncbi:alpha/beta hydrolase [Kribbella qitaiheensis]|uniref:Alpha/beta hydrolase n=1 Tax=Kribbella qitaiheensis TaxID=1544730 RepID=A0A7G6X9R8_9ACTN|nr:alpha/beta hydrolase [Kribbella qitaiheensis]